MSVAVNTSAARQSTGMRPGELPVEMAQRTLKAMLSIGEMLGTPKHIVLSHGVKQALMDTGVDLQPLLIEAPAMENVAAEEMMLEPNNLAEYLGVRSGQWLNDFLAQIGWQYRVKKTWHATTVGQRYSVLHPWMNHGKTGYNLKWNVAAVRNELQRRNMLQRKPE